MAAKRLFVGNLPETASETELKNEFSAYGKVTSVELKAKTNAFDEVNRFAFVSICISDRDLDGCIQEFKDQKFKGKYLSVSVAKESFLDRLKREREEAGLARAAKNESNVPAKKQYEPRQEHQQEFKQAVAAAQIRNTDVASSEESEEEEAAEVANNSNHNFDGKTKNSESDQKRIQSLQLMADEYKQKKLAIKSALANYTHAPKNRIVFDEGQENGYNSTPPPPKRSKPAPTLFGEEDDNEDAYNDDFKIKKQFEGEKGQKLLELQTRYRNDSRFQIDDRFKDQDYQEEAMEEDVPNDEDDERKWQLGILENVVGKKFQIREPGEDGPKNKLMTRFDPSREDHNALYINSAKVDAAEGVPKPESKKKKKTEVLKEKPALEEIEVSKETYYKISDNITDVFKPSTEGFSLLNMFGGEGDGLDNDRNESYKETIKSSTAKRKNDKNPFRYDSSDSEDEIGDLPSKESILAKKNQREKKNEIFHETLFYVADDPRLLEGTQFFRIVEKGEHAPGIDANRRDLKKIIKKKMINTYKKIGKVYKKNKN